MNDAAVLALARRAGLAVDWRDYNNKPERVSTVNLQRILTALGLPCATAEDLAHSEQLFAATAVPPLVTVVAGEAVEIPLASKKPPGRARVTMEDGAVTEVTVVAGAHSVRLPAIDSVGYHAIELDGVRTVVAVAPPRCWTVADSAGPDQQMWGPAAQIYGLRRAGDCGIGDTASVMTLARSAAASEADLLALSPVHALFTADPSRFSPYSPSTRLFYNPLHADPRTLFGEERVQRSVEACGCQAAMLDLEQRNLIDWDKSGRLKIQIFRRLFEDFMARDLGAAPASPLAADFAKFRAEGGRLLEDHARFEALQSASLQIDPAAWNWRDWPTHWRDPKSRNVAALAENNKDEIAFHCFLQWLADRSLGAAHREARQAGMRVGLVTDLAVGMSSAGSHAWTSQNEILGGLEIGAPPDLYNARGQNWGLTTFSPRALVACGFAPFIATLRAGLKHAGGIRIDHVMGLLRLWMVPQGGSPADGAYLAYPFDDLVRLIALESWRHRALVIGEDLGTVPNGFRPRLAKAGIYGMSVMLFERKASRFTSPQTWSAASVAMTSTHDLSPVAGWWRGTDIDARSKLGMVEDRENDERARSADRRSLWRAFRRAGAAAGEAPPPEAPSPAVDAAVRYIARAPSALTVLPLEDALGLEDQPNMPGTIDEYPNWRRRYPPDSQSLLALPDIQRRLRPLMRKGRQ